MGWVSRQFQRKRGPVGTNVEGDNSVQDAAGFVGFFRILFGFSYLQTGDWGELGAAVNG